MFARGQPIFTQSNSTTDLFLIDGDSEPNSAHTLGYLAGLVPTVNVYNVATSGYTIEKLVADGPTVPDYLLSTGGKPKRRFVLGRNQRFRGISCYYGQLPGSVLPGAGAARFPVRHHGHDVAQRGRCVQKRLRQCHPARLDFLGRRFR